ncbi:hypothetical protein LPTSP3_g22540 [Leptospira kobayashii]|uniref:Lipoprotein n=1 Tax=Leptospira kobayashii TaxID=1917830 RepID=A0ABN6KE73_9LEPT|nr:hypothetical protein [Leptospira kobayashii]BDA79324.1 hypothetical protein LPTSP3_g22540 [Leptospira kobayashii]
MEPFDPNTFMNKVKLKEAFYLMGRGKEADSDTMDQILANVIPKQESGFVLILRFLAGKLFVTTSEKSETEIPPLSFAFRGEEKPQFLLSYKMDDKDISLILSPNQEGTEVFLSVDVNPPASYQVQLKLDGDTIETIADLQKGKVFDSPITGDTSPEIVLLDKNKEIGRFHLLLHS